MKTKVLDLPLKGERSYIQGPDLFNAAYRALVTDSATIAGSFEVAFHRMAYHQAELVWDSVTEPENPFAVGSIDTGGECTRFWMRELDTPLSNRQPYPEEEIVDLLNFDDEYSEAHVKDLLPYSDMELWVSMIKALHQRRFADASGKWVFARAKLHNYSPAHAPASLRVKLAATLGTKLTRNSVFLNDDKVGDVFFALM